MAEVLDAREARAASQHRLLDAHRLPLLGVTMNIAGPVKRSPLTLLAEAEDTNLLHRGGLEGLRFVREQAADILSGPEDRFASRLEALDGACIRRNLSPGGSADLLALAFLLHRTGRVWRRHHTDSCCPEAGNG